MEEVRPDIWLKARYMLERRRRRTAFFTADMFGEAPWDIMLSLFASTNEARALTLTRLIELCGIPPSSCRRWLAFLEAQQLVERRTPTDDERSSTFALTRRGRQRMRDYLESE